MKVLLFFAALLALLIGALYGVNWYLTRAAERAFPPAGERRSIEGVALHYVAAGGGPPVVMIHGANGTLNDFRATLFDRLSARFHMIAVDRPGYGYSERPTDPVTPDVQARLIRGLVRSLTAERAIVVGFSFGGAVALSYGLDYADEVAGVVLLAPAAFEWPTPVDWKWQMPAWPVIGGILTDTLPQIAGRLTAASSIAGAFHPEPVSPAYVAAGFPLILRPSSFRANAADIRALKPFLRTQSARYPSFKPPLIVITGDADRVVSPAVHAEPLARAVPHAELVVIPGAGHLLPYTRSHEIVAAIERMQAARRF
jgi:pimeloyl-ACP methyl ester carboxylesterase